MKDKEFKRLSRADLVEIIYQLQQDVQSLRDENVSLKAALESKELKISEAGSIAEAVIGLSDIFNTAQAAADAYLAEIHRSNADIEARNMAMVSGAKEKADAILRAADADMLSSQKEAESIRMKARIDAERIISSAELTANTRIQSANEKIEQMLKAHAELTSFLK